MNDQSTTPTSSGRLNTWLLLSLPVFAGAAAALLWANWLFSNGSPADAIATAFAGAILLFSGVGMIAVPLTEDR